MTGKEIIKQLMAERNITNAQLANQMGITQATLWARLNNQNAKDLSLSVFSETLSALGYEIVIRRTETEPEVTEHVFEIDEASRPEGRGRPRKTDNPVTDGE